MGVSFSIGNAKPSFEKDAKWGTLSANWNVEHIKDKIDKIDIPNRVFYGNNFHFSYSGFAEFVEVTKLHDVFYENGDLVPYEFRGGHPGCFLLRSEDYDKIKAALEAREENPSGPCGFHGDNGEDTHYDWVWARLKVFEWWANWALKNCETAAIENW